MESFRGGRGSFGGFQDNSGGYGGGRGRGMGGGQYSGYSRGGSGFHQPQMQSQGMDMMGMGANRGGYFEHRGGRGGSMGNQQFRTTNYQRPPPGNVPYQTSRCK